MIPESLYMLRALELARRGEGLVEPNPMVGCVLVADGQVVGEGYHQRFGGDHAEVHALRTAGAMARGASAFVTLEPCCHQGKTPPCTQALLAAGVNRVVAAVTDPYPAVLGSGIAALRAAGVGVELGLLAAEARALNAPYFKRVATGRPWVIGKWAQTLDGKIATVSGDSRWISSEASRSLVHQLRGRVDAIVVGSGTASRDNPQLTARPPGPRTALRVVLDSLGRLSTESCLAQTARLTPVLVAVSSEAPACERERLTALGCECCECAGQSLVERFDQLLLELGRRGATNVLVEGGARLLGVVHDAGQLDEVHVFVAPKVVGGAAAPSAVAGSGKSTLDAALEYAGQWQGVGGDFYYHGRAIR